MKKKETYISPECEALEMRLEGVIAASGGFNDYNDGGSQSW